MSQATSPRLKDRTANQAQVGSHEDNICVNSGDGNGHHGYEDDQPNLAKSIEQELVHLQDRVERIPVSVTGRLTQGHQKALFRDLDAWNAVSHSDDQDQSTFRYLSKVNRNIDEILNFQPEHSSEQRKQLSNCEEALEISIQMFLEHAEALGLWETSVKWTKGALISRGIACRFYLGLNTTTGELMAIKVVDTSNSPAIKNAAKATKFRARVNREIEIMRRLRHVNILQYLGCEKTATTIEIFTEYIPGGTLAALLRKYGKLRSPLLSLFTKQILSAVLYLHQNDILHGNLRADNILIDSKGTCKIGGFGFARRKDDTDNGDMPNDIRDSVFWIAPEVIQRNEYSAKSDIWSVGCITLEMITGKRPWAKDTAVSVFFKLGTREAPVPPEVEEITEPLEVSFLVDCFQRNPSDRPTADILLSEKLIFEDAN